MSGLTGAARAAPAAAEWSEAEFYSAYEWCANPLLTLGEIRRRLAEEIERAPRLDRAWQREESLVNSYLFVCAAACTVDDYLAWRPWNFSRAAARFPRLRAAAAIVDWLLNRPSALRRLVGDRGVAAWRERWHRSVDSVCREVAALDGRPSRAPTAAGLDAAWVDAIRPLLRARLPARLLARRMRLPEAYRCQDLTPRDAISLARRFAASREGRAEPAVVLGIRTAGAYFAPLVAAFLRNAGWSEVTWMTIRPKEAVSRGERRRLRARRGSSGHVVVVDDHPNTGRTLRLAVRTLGKIGVRSADITILVPRHPVDPSWDLRAGGPVPEGVTVLTLEPSELHYVRRLDPPAMESLLREYAWDGREVRLAPNPDVDELNDRLSRQLGDGFHVRLKRAFDIRLEAPGTKAMTTRVIAKSVGCGWLGYHAYVAGRRLAGRVPPVVGLRHGLLISEWCARPAAESAGGLGTVQVRTVASYVARRTRRLPLREDPSFEAEGYRWTGWDEVVDILRGAYGPYLGRLKVPALRARLRGCVGPRPTLVDGRMRLEDWIERGTSAVKADFEQHNFGGAELDMVDPALDLAGAAFELGLSESRELDLLETYASESGDRTIRDRMLLYQILYGVVAMKRALASIGRGGSPERRQEHHRRALAARDALVFRLNRFLGGLLSRPAPSGWPGPLFFLDLDGVFDREVLGFPHTTPDGLAALELLRAHAFAVVPNTGRGVEHVRDYCRSFGFPGGVAEYGSVFFDAVNGTETALGDPRGLVELTRLREAIGRLPDVFVDPAYRYSVRALRYDGGRAAPLSQAEVETIFDRCGCERLTAFAASECSHIVAAGSGKGPGALAVARLRGAQGKPTAAIGDSDRDREMLAACDIAYAPANCSKGVRELEGAFRCRVVPESFQRGLLAAAQDLLGDRSLTGAGIPLRGHRDGAAGDLVLDILRVADRSPGRRVLAALHPWRL